MQDHTIITAIFACLSLFFLLLNHDKPCATHKALTSISAAVPVLAVGRDIVVPTTVWLIESDSLPARHLRSSSLWFCLLFVFAISWIGLPENVTAIAVLPPALPPSGEAANILPAAPVAPAPSPPQTSSQAPTSGPAPPPPPPVAQRTARQLYFPPLPPKRITGTLLRSKRPFAASTASAPDTTRRIVLEKRASGLRSCLVHPAARAQSLQYRHLLAQPVKSSASVRFEKVTRADDGSEKPISQPTPAKAPAAPTAPPPQPEAKEEATAAAEEPTVSSKEGGEEEQGRETRPTEEPSPEQTEAGEPSTAGENGLSGRVDVEKVAVPHTTVQSEPDAKEGPGLEQAGAEEASTAADNGTAESAGAGEETEPMDETADPARSIPVPEVQHLREEQMHDAPTPTEQQVSGQHEVGDEGQMAMGTDLEISDAPSGVQPSPPPPNDQAMQDASMPTEQNSQSQQSFGEDRRPATPPLREYTMDDASPVPAQISEASNGPLLVNRKSLQGRSTQHGSLCFVPTQENKPAMRLFRLTRTGPSAARGRASANFEERKAIRLQRESQGADLFDQTLAVFNTTDEEPSLIAQCNKKCKNRYLKGEPVTYHGKVWCRLCFQKAHPGVPFPRDQLRECEQCEEKDQPSVAHKTTLYCLDCWSKEKPGETPDGDDGFSAPSTYA
ncbi:uncharacterized protein LTR77_010288 [Saxophila tyrrhenica]|uniref:Uncharacterized protein n=1 Tax=Saxophila tyrrhenica TaxID=1690608 RepID=A0AAV9NZI4_9PEZI|nr:hypothetical protein LTR77_010288 [Saxophila tyrrhenica]